MDVAKYLIANSPEVFIICDKLLRTIYGSMVIGCGYQSEFALRQYIRSNSGRGRIYNGLCLNTEYRVFYDLTVMKYLVLLIIGIKT